MHAKCLDGNILGNNLNVKIFKLMHLKLYTINLIRLCFVYLKSTRDLRKELFTDYGGTARNQQERGKRGGQGDCRQNSRL